MNLKFLFTKSLLFLVLAAAYAQNPTKQLDPPELPADLVYGTFNSTRIINGQSTLNPTSGSLYFIISHQFGRINEGSYNFYGLDQSTIRLGFEYGLSDYIGIGIGRSSLNKTFDAFVKINLLRQNVGMHKMPFSITAYSNISATSLKWNDPKVEYAFKNRAKHVSQLLISRKFGTSLSLQLAPTYIYQNPISSSFEDKNIFALGFSGREKIGKKTSIVFEYYYLLNEYFSDHYQNSFSIGYNIETLGHVFQVFLTNSQGLNDEAFIARTNGKWQNGDIHIGFNIYREFPIRKMKNVKKL